MSFDRWGDSTHKMSTYNNRKHPSHKDQMYIDRMEAENKVMFPYQEPYAVTRSYPVGGTGLPNRITKGQKISRPASQPCRGPTPQENRKMVTTQDPLTGDQNCQAHKENTERGRAKTPQLGNHRESPIKDRPLPLLGKTFWKKMNSQMTQHSWTRQMMKLTMKPHPKAPG